VTGGCVAHLLIGLVLVAVAPALYALHYLLKPAIVQIVVYVVETIVELFWHLTKSHARYCCVSCMARDIFAFQVAIPDLLRIAFIGLQSTRLGHFLIPFGKLIKALDSWYMFRVLPISAYGLFVHQDILMHGIVFVIIFTNVLLFFIGLFENYFTVGLVWRL
jgi:hypothetical protein